jgi:hypothetical protein
VAALMIGPAIMIRWAIVMDQPQRRRADGDTGMTIWHPACWQHTAQHDRDDRLLLAFGRSVHEFDRSSSIRKPQLKPLYGGDAAMGQE